MKQYLLAVHINEGEGPSPEAMSETYDTVDEFNTEVQAAGAWEIGRAHV